MSPRAILLVTACVALLFLGGCGLSVDQRWAGVGTDDDPPAVEQDAELTALREKAEADPESASARRALAEGLVARGMVAESLSLWAGLLRDDPSDEELATGLLDAVRFLGVPETLVERLCRRILEEDDDNQGALWLLGELFLTQNQMRQARHFHMLAWRADPTYWRAALSLARVAGFQLQIQEARRWCARAETAVPGTYEARAELAATLLQTGDVRKALATSATAIELGPGYPLPYTIRARALLAANRPQEATEALGQALELTPDTERIADPQLAAGFSRLRRERYGLLGQAYLDLGRVTEARAALQKALDEERAGDPPAELNFQMAMACQALGDAQTAIEYYRKVSEQDAGQIAALNNYAYLCAEEGHHLDEALRAAETAADIAPAATTYDTLGWVLYQRGEYVEAAANLEKAHAQDATEPEVLFHLGMAYSQLGRAAEGVELLQQARKLAGANRKLTQKIAEHLPGVQERAQREG